MYTAYLIFTIVLIVSFITGIILLIKNKKMIDVKFTGGVIDYIDSIIYIICLIFSNGFFFYFYILFYLIDKVIHNKLKDYFKLKMKDTLAFLFLVMMFFVGVFLHTLFYKDNNIKRVNKDIINSEVVEKKLKLDSKESNQYRKYSKLDINSISISKLKKINNDVVTWIMVDGTGINYPVVKGSDNSFYLTHDINKDKKLSGWIYMDYRNSDELDDDNTIIYGHNLVNKTAFGSLTNLFEKSWFNNSNHYIVLLKDNKKYVYEVFSIYTIKPETYYLQNNFSSKDSYNEFINTIKGRSKYDFKVNVDNSDKILTLSTCTEDNKDRRVVHAKKIK